MAEAEKIEKIGKVTQSIARQAPNRVPDEDRFSALMTQDIKDETTKSHKVETENQKSLMDEIRDVSHQVQHAKRATPEMLAVEAEKVVGNIEQLKNKLADPDLTIKNSARSVLRNKLRHIDQNLKVALTKAGIEYTPPEATTGLVTPMQRFLGFLTHAETAMQTLASEVRGMHERKDNISPADMLLVQIKVAQVQQEIELFANVLNKALESTKTIMNIQV